MHILFHPWIEATITFVSATQASWDIPWLSPSLECQSFWTGFLPFLFVASYYEKLASLNLRRFVRIEERVKVKTYLISFSIVAARSVQVTSSDIAMKCSSTCTAQRGGMEAKVPNITSTCSSQPGTCLPMKWEGRWEWTTPGLRRSMCGNTDYTQITCYRLLTPVAKTNRSTAPTYWHITSPLTTHLLATSHPPSVTLIVSHPCSFCIIVRVLQPCMEVRLLAIHEIFAQDICIKAEVRVRGF